MAEKQLEKTASEKLIRVMTVGRKTGNPHTVELWFAVSKGRVYLSHERPKTDWMKNIKNNDQISFEINRKNFTGRAPPTRKRHSRSMGSRGGPLQEILR
jgi:nitroimidazol reductase NimA-like FMN-containing flavoprotein (pyridoxamine 5'-phosphate oxidase superfamily)